MHSANVVQMCFSRGAEATRLNSHVSNSIPFRPGLWEEGVGGGEGCVLHYKFNKCCNFKIYPTNTEPINSLELPKLYLMMCFVYLATFWHHLLL